MRLFDLRMLINSHGESLPQVKSTTSMDFAQHLYEIMNTQGQHGMTPVSWFLSHLHDSVITCSQGCERGCGTRKTLIGLTPSDAEHVKYHEWVSPHRFRIANVIHKRVYYRAGLLAWLLKQNDTNAEDN